MQEHISFPFISSMPVVTVPDLCLKDGTVHTLLVAAPLVGTASSAHVAVLTSLQEVSVFDACELAAPQGDGVFSCDIAQQDGGGAAPAARLRLRHAVAALALSDSFLAAGHGSQVRV